MNRWRWLVWTSAVGSLVVGCGGGSPAPAVVSSAASGRQSGAAHPVAPKSAPTPAPLPAKPKLPEPGPPLPPLTYDAKGRRDPFVPVVQAASDKPGVEFNGLKLVGVVSGRQLLALVEATGGLGYILKPGDSIGNGHVTDISSDSVTFAVGGQASGRETSVTLRLAAN
jgi:hypothetical protein